MSDTKLLSEAIVEKGRRAHNANVLSVRRYTGANTDHLIFSFGQKVLVDAGLQDAKRLDARLESGQLVFFEPSLPGGGWATIKPGRSRRLYLRFSYVEGVPFSLSNQDTHRLEIIETDSTKHTLSVSTVLSDST